MLREFMIQRATWHQMCICNGYWDNIPHEIACMENYKSYLRMCDAEDRITLVMTGIAAIATVIGAFIILSFVIVMLG